MRGGGADGAWEVPGGGRLVWHLYTLPFGCALRRQGLAPAWLVCGIYICTIYLLFWLCHLRRQGNNISLDAAPLHPPCIRPASALFDDSVLLLRGSLAMAREAVHGFRLYFVLPWGVLACAPMISSADPLQTADACKAALPACLPACLPATLRCAICAVSLNIFLVVFFLFGCMYVPQRIGRG